MLPLAALVLAGASAGLVGSLVGLGGGIIVIPILTLFLDVPIHQAVAASLVAVVATSSVSAIGYTRDEITNIKLGMTLEVATTLGAVGGGLAASLLDREALSALFAVFLVFNAAYLVLKQRLKEAAPPSGAAAGVHAGRYFDPALGREVSYEVRRLPLGLAVSAVAGAISGLLGIGGGPIKVPLMTTAMGVPMKAAAATSTFMIGVTACASAALYYARGLVSPAIAVPVALGVSAGALAGSRLAPRVRGATLSTILAAVLAALAVQMLLAAAGIRLR